MPNLETNQYGNLYYMSSVNFFWFGVNDNSRVSDADDMAAYIWHKKDGKRGDNIITLYLWKDFQNCGFLLKKYYRSLALIVDNCEGENENEKVLQFLMWLVELGFFPTIKVFF